MPQSNTFFSVRSLLIAGQLLAGSGFAGPTPAAALVDTAIVSPDITVDLSGTTLDDHLVGDDDLAGTVVAIAIGSLPDSSDVTAYYLEAGTDDELFSLDVTVDLGGLIVAPGDIVRFNGTTYTLEFDASAEGLPDGAVTDAVAIAGSDLLLSFDTTVSLDGSTYDDEDLVRFDGTMFTAFFDGSANGVPSSLDLDAAHYFESDGKLALSFDSSATIGGVSFDDEDAISYEIGTGSWALIYDGSAEHPGWSSADLVAVHFVPEPGVAVTLATGVGFLLTVGRRRIREASGPDPTHRSDHPHR